MHEQNFKNTKLTEVTKKAIKDLLVRVATKLSKSAEKYGDTMWVNDTKKELDEEIDDIVGWTVLEAVRLKQVANVKFARLDKIYWEKVFNHMTDDQLVFLQHKINKEVDRRGA